MKPTVIKTDNAAVVMANIRELVRKRVLIGVPDSAPERKIEDGEAPSNAVIGYTNEFGSPAENIPARPHLIPGVILALDDMTKRMRAAAKSAITGNAEKMEAHLMAAGFLGQNSVRRKINTGPFVPLAPYTIMKRRTRKPPRMGTLPLRDTGQYINSIIFVVETRGTK